MSTRIMRRRMAQAAWDGASWVFAVPIALTLRYDLSPPSQIVWFSLGIGFACAVVYVALGFLFRLYRGRYVVGSFDEVAGISFLSLLTAVAMTLVMLPLAPPNFPRSTVVIAALLAMASMFTARYVWRGSRQQNALSRVGTRTLIFGAGDAGSQVLNLMLADRQGEFQPVGFIDDDPAKQHLRRGGIRVLGTSKDLESLIQELEVETLLVAIAGVSADTLLELDRRCRSFGVDVRIIPTASEIAGGAVKLGDISDITEEDLMGRRSIQTDERQITEFITGKRILVTGAGGSIGSELVRQLTSYKPAALFLLDRDESALHAVQLTLDGSGNLMSQDLILADIRDKERISRIFQDLKPEIVFHAAALKHLPLLERFPEEAWKTNVLGTKNILQAAEAVGVTVFVNISTDKAADPTSVLGYSKLITERLTAGVGRNSGKGKFVSVRFGNVLGSRGSVIHTFRYQIANGGPVTVTDESVTRYFMTVREAVHLVLQASVLGSNGETLILDMGVPVRIAEVAEYMIRRSGREIAICYTGLRPGEKLDEALISEQEIAMSPHHPMISHTQVRSISPESLGRQVANPDFGAVLKELSVN